MFQKCYVGTEVKNGMTKVYINEKDVDQFSFRECRVMITNDKRTYLKYREEREWLLEQHSPALLTRGICTFQICRNILTRREVPFLQPIRLSIGNYNHRSIDISSRALTALKWAPAALYSLGRVVFGQLRSLAVLQRFILLFQGQKRDSRHDFLLATELNLSEEEEEEEEEEREYFSASIVMVRKFVQNQFKLNKLELNVESQKPIKPLLM